MCKSEISVPLLIIDLKQKNKIKSIDDKNR